MWLIHGRLHYQNGDLHLLSDEVYRVIGNPFGWGSAPREPDLVRLLSYGDDYPMPGTYNDGLHTNIINLRAPTQRWGLESEHMAFDHLEPKP